MNVPHEFAVGQRYENRKGVYEVISIDGDEMVIRWDTGEQITTPIEAQARFIRNMEKELAEAAGAKRRFRVPKSFGELFVGLKSEDFSEDVTGTHWRSREQLGGAVTQLLNFSEPFNSWSIYKRPEVHWASVDRYARLPAWLQIKFFARVSTDDLHFGLYVERADNLEDDCSDWLRFLAWAEEANNCGWLLRTMHATGAQLTNPYEHASNQAFTGVVSALGNGHFRWETENPSEIAAAELSGFLKALPDDRWLNMVIGRRLGRDEAINAGASIAGTIANFFNTLEPIYSHLRV